MLFIHLFFFNDTATTEIYTLSLHDALPIFPGFALKLILGEMADVVLNGSKVSSEKIQKAGYSFQFTTIRSEEHTSELQSQSNLVCRLLLEKKKLNNQTC